MPNNHIDENTLILVAEMYYLNRMSQQQIAERFNCSRTNITRMLKICVEQGIVEFKIKKPSNERINLQNQLQKIFSIQQVIVVPSNGSHEQAVSRVGESTATYLDSIIENGNLIGIPYGSTVFQTVNHFNPTKNHQADVIQFIGGLSTKGKEYDGQYIVNNLQSKLNGRAHLLHAPFIVQGEAARKILLDEPAIKNHFSEFRNTDIAIIGIGHTHSTFSAIYKAGYITKKAADDLYYHGAVADLCGSQIDEFGHPCRTEISERTIGISLEDLARIPVRIGCAAGPSKSVAILAALRGNYVNVLVTDEDAAVGVLNLLSDAERKRAPIS